MSNILTRLLLNTSDYDTKLKRAKGSTNDFASNIGSKAAAAVGKFAAGIGVAMGGVEAFEKLMGSSQRTGDAYASTMEAAKTSVDQFFYSLSNGSFSTFLNGLGDMIAKAREAHAVMDQLGNTRISHGYFSSKYQSQIQEAQYTAKNKFAPLDERKLAFDQWKEALKMQGEANETLRADLLNAIQKSVESEIGEGKFTVDMNDVEMAMKIDITRPGEREKLKERYASSYDAYNTRRNYLENEKRGTLDKGRLGGIETELNELESIYREAIIVNAMLNKYKDEELQNIASMGAEYNALRGSLVSMGREYNETANEFNNANKAVKGFVAATSLEDYKVYSGNSEASRNFGGGSTSQTPIVGSLAALDEEIRAAQAQYANAATQSARMAALKALQELEKQKIEIELDLKYGQGLADGSDALTSIKNNFKELSQMPELKPLKAIEKSPITSGTGTKNVDEFTQALGAISGIMGALNTANSDNAVSFLNWADTAATASAQVVESVKAVIGAKTVEGAASAGASAAQTPVVGWLLVGGAIAAALAAFASLPAFAEGGVVGGSSYFGDKLLARVNSGEVILSQNQQGRLLGMLDGGSRVVVDGEARISGKAMYIAIRNYMKSENVKW